MAFVEPAASLVGATVHPRHPGTAVHFRGPSWESTQDGSLVVGMPYASVPSPYRAVYRFFVQG